MNSYRILLPLEVHLSAEEGGGSYKQGEEFEKEFDSPADEQANLDSGLLEIVPRDYKIIGGSDVFEHKPGEIFSKALTMGQEASLIAGGHIERVKAPAPKQKKKEE